MFIGMTSIVSVVARPGLDGFRFLDDSDVTRLKLHFKRAIEACRFELAQQLDEIVHGAH